MRSGRALSMPGVIGAVRVRVEVFARVCNSVLNVAS